MATGSFEDLDDSFESVTTDLARHTEEQVVHAELALEVRGARQDAPLGRQSPNPLAATSYARGRC